MCVCVSVCVCACVCVEAVAATTSAPLNFLLELLHLFWGEIAVVVAQLAQLLLRLRKVGLWRAWRDLVTTTTAAAAAAAAVKQQQISLYPTSG